MNKRLINYGSIYSLFFILNFIVASSVQAGLEPGNPLPVFKLTSLDGQEVALQDYRGKIVIVHLWKCQ